MVFVYLFGMERVGCGFWVVWLVGFGGFVVTFGGFCF